MRSCATPARHTLAVDDDQERRMRLLLLAKGAVLARRFESPLAAPLDDEQARRVRLLLLSKGAVLAHQFDPPVAPPMDDDQLRARSRPQRAVDRHHWCPAGVDGVDDLCAVDALEVDRGDAKVGVSELALDDDQRDTFAPSRRRERGGAGAARIVA
jgi:hypothetical protein